MKRKQNGRLNRALGKSANAPRVEDTIAGSYKSASPTIVAQIQWRIKARWCAAKLAVLVKLFGRQKLKKFSLETFAKK